jgi:hypothetical protein
MELMYYIGLDVHKRKISYCVKDARHRAHAYLVHTTRKRSDARLPRLVMGSRLAFTDVLARPIRNSVQTIRRPKTVCLDL